MPNPIEAKGMSILKEYLRKRGRIVEESSKKTFDLIVDGKYAEVKTKNKAYKNLDFLSFTDKQYEKIKNDIFSIFIVCNVKESSNIEIFELSSEALKKIEPKKYTSYEYNKSVLDRIKKIKI
jgi:hypothetical protein